MTANKTHQTTGSWMPKKLRYKIQILAREEGVSLSRMIIIILETVLG